MGNPYVNENPNAWNPPNAYPGKRGQNADGTPQIASWTPPPPPPAPGSPALVVNGSFSWPGAIGVLGYLQRP